MQMIVSFPTYPTSLPRITLLFHCYFAAPEVGGGTEGDVNEPTKGSNPYLLGTS